MEGDIKVVRVCEVIWVDDNTDSNRIKVRLLPDDEGETIDQLPYVIPFLPQMVHIRPKLHEAVLILLAVATNGKSQRYYIGPVISQINHMYNEPMEDALGAYNTSIAQKDPAVTMNKNETLGAVPKREDIALVGRKLSDVILSDNDLRIRCGAKKVDKQDTGTFTFNGTDSAFIKLKYYEDGLEGVDKCHSTATIVADKINLVSNRSKDVQFSTQDKEEFINDDDMRKLIDTAHELPYGDKLVEFLKLFRKVFVWHTHPFPMLPPCRPDNFVSLYKYNLDSILSENVRIN